MINWWKGDGSMIDFFNPAAVAWWKGLMDKTLDMGIDGWKCDGTDYSIILGATYSPGAGRTVDRIEYSHAYYRLFHDYTRQRLGDDRVNMSRPVDNYGFTFITDPNLVSFTPVDIGWACWVGDQDATFDGLKNALNNMYESDQNDYLVVGSDIGGYREESVPNGRDKDLFIRWAQLGAFSPLMENGGGGEHRPWMFDQQTEDIYREFVNIHHALIPYFMIQSDSLFNAEKSLMQFFNDNAYPFMLGSDVFVTPILSANNTVSVSFPGVDSWVYMFDLAETHAGGSNATLAIPLDEYPVFIKASSPLVATLDSVLNGVTGLEAHSPKLEEFQIYPNPASNEFQISGLEFKVGEQHELRLYDVLGQHVLVRQLSDETQTINVEELEAGVYFYTVRNIVDSTAKNEMESTGRVVIR